MTRQLCMWAFVFSLCFATAVPIPAQAQTLVIGRGGIRYSGYGQGYYGGYGYRPHYNGYFPKNQYYSGYGNGPYSYGAGSSRQFPPIEQNAYGNPTLYYGDTVYPTQPMGPVYNPYGYGHYNSYRW